MRTQKLILFVRNLLHKPLTQVCRLSCVTFLVHVIKSALRPFVGVRLVRQFDVFDMQTYQLMSLATYSKITARTFVRDSGLGGPDFQ